MIENRNKGRLLEQSRSNTQEIQETIEGTNKTSFWNRIKESKFIQNIKNIPSNISNKIQSFWERRKQKALPEAQETKNNSNEGNNLVNKEKQEKITEEQSFRDSIKTRLPRVDAKSFNSIDGAIQQYLMAYVVKARDGVTSSYKALTSIAGKFEPGESQRATEVSFLNGLRESHGFRIVEQVRGKMLDSNQLEDMYEQGDAAFYHVMTNAWDQVKPKIDTRLYLNPTRNNMLELVNQIFQRNGDNPLYLKFQSDNQLSNEMNERNEKIVIYTNSGQNGNLGRVVNILEEIKQESPQLFDGSEIMNPFMEQVAGVAAIAKQPLNNIYTRLDGMQEKVSQSYNTFLAKALEESTNKVINDITNSNAIPGFNNFSLVEKIEMLLQNGQSALISGIKEYLAQCQQNNPSLAIRGIGKAQEKNIGKEQSH